MAVEQFSFRSLATIDGGRLLEAWEQACKRAREDVEDRPGVEKARKVMLVTTLTPVKDKTNGLHSVDVKFEIDDSLPKRSSPTYNMKAARGGLLFNEMSPDDIDQGTFPGMGPKGSVEDNVEKKQGEANAG